MKVSLYVFLFLNLWESRTYCPSFVSFGHEKGSSEFLRKTISSSCKIIQKIKTLQRQHKKESWINTYKSLPPLCFTTFLKDRNEISIKLGGEMGGNFLKKICMGNQKREGRRNTKVIERYDVTVSYNSN